MTGTSSRLFRQAFLLVLPLTLALALGACREEEQGRSLHYQKGTYQGAPDRSLDQSTVGALQQRVNNQRAP